MKTPREILSQLQQLSRTCETPEDGVLKALKIIGDCQDEAARGRMNLNTLATAVHEAHIGWWKDVNTGQPIKRNKGEMLALIHSEISEALEGERKDLMDDKLPHRKMAEVELADALIRIFDYAAGFGYDLQGAFDEKMAFNRNRLDHTHEARRLAGGKQF